MGRHNLTRVRFEGGQTIIVAGPIPDDLAVGIGFSDVPVTVEPAPDPLKSQRPVNPQPRKQEDK